VSGVESDMRGIGELARRSGLTVSALRFYDRAGVLVPAMVDPATGYRRYRDDQVRAARLIAALRRVGMPVADITAAVRALPDPRAVRPMLDRHLSRLEDGLADARRELSRAHALLDQEVPVTRVTLPAAELTAALNAVRFAARPAGEPAGEAARPAGEPAGEAARPAGETPGAGNEAAGTAGDDARIAALSGILFEAGDGTLTLVATDRFRLAVASTPAVVDGPPVRVIVPVDLLDRVRGGDITLTLGEEKVVIGDVEGCAIPGDYPDFRRLVRTAAGPQVGVDVAALRAAVQSAPDVWREHDGRAYPMAILKVAGGEVRLAAEDEWDGDAEAHVAVSRDFLVQALDANGAGQLVLELDGPIRPLAIRTAERDRFSLLMPVRH
jgi:DNA polymerase-3 subunit beta